ncbi:hypothetical protein NDU88_002898 [Pleurodeles waltl]|uniref:Uncharacterized protein n=1 Tax=Pleurodeles waltl TaxID=8319 RepID=A0AAV7VEV7_PLEWA|nr:hypothetical protein NDU88_002898 [Pleurodeles waltl]
MSGGLPWLPPPPTLSRNAPFLGWERIGILPQHDLPARSGIVAPLPSSGSLSASMLTLPVLTRKESRAASRLERPSSDLVLNQHSPGEAPGTLQTAPHNCSGAPIHRSHGITEGVVSTCRHPPRNR